MIRDSKVLFHNDVAPTTASTAVDAASSEPGVGRKAFIGASCSGDPAASAVTVTISSSDTEAGTYAVDEVITVDAEKVKVGGAILSQEIPTVCRRWMKTAWAGISAGTITDGIDYGLKDGKAATQPYAV